MPLRVPSRSGGSESAIPPAVKGLIYNPLIDAWSLGADTDVNYLASAAKPG